MAQPAFGSMNARHDGADWALQRLADLMIAQATNNLKQQRYALPVGQFADGADYLLIEDLIELTPVFYVKYLRWRRSSQAANILSRSVTSFGRLEALLN